LFSWRADIYFSKSQRVKIPRSNRWHIWCLVRYLFFTDALMEHANSRSLFSKGTNPNPEPYVLLPTLRWSVYHIANLRTHKHAQSWLDVVAPDCCLRHLGVRDKFKAILVKILFQKQNKNKRIVDAPQVIECLPRKHVVLGSMHSIAKTNKIQQ
jgi:hypothetical protein